MRVLKAYGGDQPSVKHKSTWDETGGGTGLSDLYSLRKPTMLSAHHFTLAGDARLQESCRRRRSRTWGLDDHLRTCGGTGILLPTSRFETRLVRLKIVCLVFCLVSQSRDIGRVLQL